MLPLGGSGLGAGVVLHGVVDEVDVFVVKTQKHGSALLFRQHEVERVQAPPQRQGNALLEAVVRAGALAAFNTVRSVVFAVHAEHAAAHAEIADSLANLTELPPAF
jgi:hypothetical protein